MKEFNLIKAAKFLSKKENLPEPKKIAKARALLLKKQELRRKLFGFLEKDVHTETVPGNLTLDFDKIGLISKLPKGLSVEGTLTIQEQSKLRELPEGLKAKELKLIHCPNLFLSNMLEVEYLFIAGKTTGEGIIGIPRVQIFNNSAPNYGFTFYSDITHLDLYEGHLPIPSNVNVDTLTVFATAFRASYDNNNTPTNFKVESIIVNTSEYGGTLYSEELEEFKQRVEELGGYIGKIKMTY